MKQPSKDQALWFAAQTKYRCEKAVQRYLEKQQITNYLPIVNTPRLHGSRRRIVEKPLIPGYVFVHIAYQDYLKVLKTENIIDLVRFGSEIVPIPQQEIDLLQKFCTSIDYEIVLGRPAYQSGDIVQVVAGPLKGIVGRLITVQGRKNLVVELKNVGHSLQVVQMKMQYVRRIQGSGI